MGLRDDSTILPPKLRIWTVDASGLTIPSAVGTDLWAVLEPDILENIRLTRLVKFVLGAYEGFSSVRLDAIGGIINETI
jgi:hypothetical protein